MKKFFAFALALVFVISTNAQTLRPGVLVVGNDNAATAAAIQSAVSGAKTILLTQAPGFDLVNEEADLPSGILAQFQEKLQKAGIKTFDKQKASEVMKTWVDSLKNLTVISNMQCVKADRSGKNWVFKLVDDRTIRPHVLVMSPQTRLMEKLKLTAKPAQWNKFDYQNPIYKTSVSAGKKLAQGKGFYSIYNLLDSTQENLILLSDQQSSLIGQSAGATAAYAAFFSKNTSESNLKAIQGELINYKLNVIPFEDVKPTDSNWKSIQLVGITGVLEGKFVDGKLLFEPEKTVSAADVKQKLKDHYYKAQIWFDDYKQTQMTIGATLEFACYAGHKSLPDTKRRVEKIWKTAYNFKTELDYNRPITRREFAVLMQDFCPPFNVSIDKQGNITR